MSTRRKKASSRPAPAALALAAHCCIKDAAGLQEQLLAVVAHPAAVELDMDAVERIDTAALQVLCAFVQQRVAEGRTVQWRGEGSVLREAAGQLGVQSLLGLQQEAA